VCGPDKHGSRRRRLREVGQMRSCRQHRQRAPAANESYCSSSSSAPSFIGFCQWHPLLRQHVLQKALLRLLTLAGFGRQACSEDVLQQFVATAFWCCCDYVTLWTVVDICSSVGNTSDLTVLCSQAVSCSVRVAPQGGAAGCLGSRRQAVEPAATPAGVHNDAEVRPFIQACSRACPE